jgi:hypothetical protein
MKSTFPWMQRHYVNYYKGEQLYETNRRETALTHPRGSWIYSYLCNQCLSQIRFDVCWICLRFFFFLGDKSREIKVCNAAFNNITVISWRLALLVDETEVSGENNRPAQSH